MPAKSLIADFPVSKEDIFSFIFDRKDKPYADDKVLLRDAYTNRTYSWKQLKDTIVSFGTGLKSMWEWKKGNVLAIVSANDIDYPAVMWGALWAGGTCTPANPGYNATELAFQFKDSGACAIATQLPFLETVLQAAKEAGISEDRICLIGDQKDTTYKFKHFTGIRNLAGTSRYRKSKVDPENDLAFLPYSSGTTGKPKGVMLCHRNITSNVLQINSVESHHLSPKGGPDNQGDKVLAFLPFFHIYGLVVLVHQSVWAGYELVVMPRFNLEDFCRLTQDHKITMIYVAPPVVLQLGKNPIVDKYDLSSIRMMNSGAAPLTKDLVDAVYERIKVPVKQGYGLSETSPCTHTQTWETWQTAQGSVGLLLPNQEAKYVVDDKEVSVGQVGELWVKGPNVFMGYLNNVKGTRESITDDGYFKTGDVGYQDKDGNFYITDRVKELIKYKGFQVPPAELEGKLVAHPKVDDVCVVGIYSKEQASELPRAYVVVKHGVEENDATAKEIQSWMAANVANHKQLRGGVRFLKEVPKSVSGKILRRVLKDQIAKEEAGTKAKL